MVVLFVILSSLIVHVNYYFKLSSITSFEHTPAKNTAMGKRNMRRLVVFVDIMNIRVWCARDGGQALWRQ